MSELEKERAIHDYLIDWIKYDSAVHDQGPNSHPDPDNNNPYGALINKKAICTGYAYSFELFMDILGYECITIEGSSGGEAHGWNMIIIGGEWYCVDVTWDDSGRTLKHFNQSSEAFRRSGHVWDETAGYPVAPKSME
jgi:transglutaminase/protease-like cytokinesis protein 3